MSKDNNLYLENNVLYIIGFRGWMDYLSNKSFNYINKVVVKDYTSGIIGSLSFDRYHTDITLINCHILEVQGNRIDKLTLKNSTTNLVLVKNFSYIDLSLDEESYIISSNSVSINKKTFISFNQILKVGDYYYTYIPEHFNLELKGFTCLSYKSKKKENEVKDFIINLSSNLI